MTNLYDPKKPVLVVTDLPGQENFCVACGNTGWVWVGSFDPSEDYQEPCKCCTKDVDRT